MEPAAVLSSDSHVFEPPDLWTTRIDPAFRHRAPRMQRIDGADQLVVEADQVLSGIGLISNAGAQEHKPATSTINCTVSGTIRDSMDDILGKVHEAGLTLKAGCGIGY